MCFGKFCQYKPRISHGWSFPRIQSFYHIQIGMKLASQNEPEIRCNLFCCLLNLKILLPDLFHRCLKHPSSKMRSCENRPHSIVIFHLKDLFCDFNRIRTIIHMRNNVCGYHTNLSYTFLSVLSARNRFYYTKASYI